MAIGKTLQLEDRIKSLRDEIDAFIDGRVDEIAKDCPGVPDGVIRNSITRGLGCQCAAYLEVKAKDAETQRGAA
ncbi:hypothetical protein ABIA85_003455 [Bradyrhizobium sp. LA6.10]|uniref:hypothetical protein n=1 Tax=Bradyrhizobium sp. LA6.10 TaxID=3156318 RepID=UPI003399FFAE